MKKTPEAKLDLVTLSSIPAGVWALGVVSLLTDISTEMIQALLPIYLVTSLGVSTLTVGIIEGIAEATSAFVKIYSGALSDRIGKRKLLVILGYGMAAVTKPVFPLASSVGWLIAARFIDRIGKGIRGAPRDALIADITPEGLRGASFGLRQSLDTVGAVLGPLLAIVFMWIFSNNITAVFWVAVLPAFLAVAFMIWGVHEPSHPVGRPRVAKLFEWTELARLGRDYWIVVAIAIVFSFARFSEAFLLLRAQSVGSPTMLVPAVLVVMNIVYASAAYPAGALSDNGNRSRLLFLGLVALICADLVLAFGGTVSMVLLGAAIWGLHMGLTQGLLMALVADTAPDDLRGTAFGIYHFLTGLALLAASILAGALWNSIGPQATFVSGAAFTGLALAAVIGSSLAGAHWTSVRR